MLRLDLQYSEVSRHNAMPLTCGTRASTIASRARARVSAARCRQVQRRVSWQPTLLFFEPRLPEGKLASRIGLRYRGEEVASFRFGERVVLKSYRRFAPRGRCANF